MSAVLYYFNRVKETTSTTGTGNITLAGAVSQFVSFSSRVPLKGRFAYAIVGQSGSTEWEVGEGYLLDSATIVRAQVYESSNSDALVSFSNGVKDVFITSPASLMRAILTGGQGLAGRAGLAMP